MKRALWVCVAMILLWACKKETKNNVSTGSPSSTFNLNRIDNVLFTNDNGTLIAGVYHHKYTIIKTNENFDIVWSKNSYEWGNFILGLGWGPMYNSIQIVKMFQRTDGTYVCICSLMSSGDDVRSTTLVIELNQKGEQINKHEFKDLSTSNALQTSDGGYALFGTQLVKLDAKFNQQWAKNLIGNTYYSTQIISTVDGGFATTGGSYDTDQAFLKQLDSKGDEISSTSYKYNAYSSNEDGADLIQLQDKSFLIIGRTRNVNQLSDFDCKIIRTDVKGDTLWTKRFGNSTNEWLDRIVSSDQNEFVIQGSSGFPNEIQKSILLKINLDGQILDSCRVNKFPMILYSPLKYYVKVQSIDTAHINFAVINKYRLFVK
jgi:hypothetical protein